MRVDIHGVATEASADPGDELLGPFLEFFPATQRPPELRIRIDVVDAPSPTPDPRSWRPAFFFGVIQGYVNPDADAYVLYDGSSCGYVDARTATLSLALLRTKESGSPLTTSGLLHSALCLALREFGLFELHGAAVGGAGSGRLIVGNSGSGKTSLTVGMITAGLQYLGDDRVLVRGSASRNPAFELCGYPRAFHIGPATARAFSGLRGLLRGEDGLSGKSALSPRLAFPQAFRPRWHGATSILLPRIVDAPHTQIAPVSPADAFGALLESSALAVVDGVRHRDPNLAVLTAIANAAPAFRVDLGRDTLEHPRATAEHIFAATESSG